MKPRVARPLAIVAAALTLGACQDPTPDAPPGSVPPTTTEPPQPEAKKKHAALEGYAAYDGSLDGKKQIEGALARAKSESKRVLVMFGGNWCKWCRALDGLFTSDDGVKQALEKSFVLLHVDSETNDALNQELGDPFRHGFPVLVVLDADGKPLHTQETASLEKADKSVAHDPAKVLAFLEQWAPKG